MTACSQEWMDIRPTFRDDSRVASRFRRLVRFLSMVQRDEPDFALVVHDFRRRALESLPRPTTPEMAELRVAFSVLTDLFVQGWGIKVEGDSIKCARPFEQDEVSVEKDRVRSGLLIARDEQLREESVREFVRSMEQPRLYKGQWVSIFSLMRDGVSLAAGLEETRSLTDILSVGEAVGRLVEPYIQFVEDGAHCDQTGIRLLDIWRYFRHTWLTPLRSTPGRTMPLLIRDRAAIHHPIIGIAALSSSIVQQSERDKWVGWRGEDVLHELDTNPDIESADWLLRQLQNLTDGVYIGDFLKQGVLELRHLKAPTWALIDELRNLAEECKQRHKMQIPGTRSKAGASGDFLTEAQTDLFKFKRAATLADLLDIRLAFNQVGLVYAEARSLVRALESDVFRLAVAKLVRKIKGNNVGINMMDISVAGAVEPYRAILGGKLVSMMLCSPEVVEEYRRRYSQQPSVIASALKGRAVYKEPTLVLLCTTGLFGGGSSQYNRITISVGDDKIRFYKLDQKTEYGTFQFSQTTMAEMKNFGEIDFRGAITNGIFGEGVNPKMRKIRESLDRVGLPSTEFLRHSTPRSVYVIPLCRNFREVLLGKDDAPSYFISVGDAKTGTEFISDLWKRRWLIPRIANEFAIAQVRSHSSDFTVTHGARVNLPDVDEEQASLFEDVEDDEDFEAS